jgi:hypothetical protein
VGATSARRRQRGGYVVEAFPPVNTPFSKFRIASVFQRFRWSPKRLATPPSISEALIYGALFPVSTRNLRFFRNRRSHPAPGHPHPTLLPEVRPVVISGRASGSLGPHPGAKPVRKPKAVSGGVPIGQWPTARPRKWGQTVPVSRARAKELEGPRASSTGQTAQRQSRRTGQQVICPG